MSQADVEIAECIDAGTSFILDAGAGAGKTYSLVECLKHIARTRRRALVQSGQQVACITFTNVAKDEIIERIGRDPLVRVSTIHDFLWDMIQPHQDALRAAVIKYNGDLSGTSNRKKDAVELAVAIALAPVVYSDRGSNLLKGRLFHDDLLSVARIMFADNPMLAKITAAKHPYLFVDEYQDTSPAVIETLLGSLLPRAEGRLVIGFFGDRMQNIYHGGDHAGVGEIPAAMAVGLRAIVKPENRRCSKAVIKVLNHLRTDIQQFPAANNVEGDAVYVHPGDSGEAGLGKAQAHLAGKFGWKPADTKELYLTHRLIGRKAGYGDLLRLYGERGGFHRDRLVAGDDEAIAIFIQALEPFALAWSAADEDLTISLLRKSGFHFTKNSDKAATKAALDKLMALRATATVAEVLRHAGETGLVSLPDKLKFRLEGGQVDIADLEAEAVERETRERTFYPAFFDLPYRQIVAYAEFFGAHTPYATKHGVKGAEFDNVVVILDDEGANWNLYSFAKYLSGEDAAKNEKRWIRTRNVFYVCCSRPRQILAVIDLTARSAAKDARVRTIFGDTAATFL